MLRIRGRALPASSLALALALGASSARAGDVSVQLDSGSGFSLKNAAGAIERLRVDEATGNVSRNGVLFVHTTGSSNLFVGPGAGNGAITGTGNSAFGVDALLNNTTAYQNSAFGTRALRSNTTGHENSAFGFEALRDNTTGSQSEAFGRLALYNNTTGARNTALGTYALRSNTSGSRNVAIGYAAGQSQTTGNDNIYIATSGLVGESGHIRIGEVGAHTQTYLAGIHGATSSGGIAVLVNVNGKLGTATSSARFKQDVRDMEDASDVLMRLRPVTFHYREDAVGAEEAKATQYGLIAEEVAEVAPELVAPDAEGRPYSVRYHVLPALLLNEVKEQHRINEEQKQVIAALSARLDAIESAAGAACEAGSR